MKRQGVNWAKRLLYMAANDRPPQAFSLLRSTLGELFVSLLSGYCVISGFERHGLADHLPRFESRWLRWPVGSLWSGCQCTLLTLDYY